MFNIKSVILNKKKLRKKDYDVMAGDFGGSRIHLSEKLKIKNKNEIIIKYEVGKIHLQGEY